MGGAARAPRPADAPVVVAPAAAHPRRCDRGPGRHPHAGPWRPRPGRRLAHRRDGHLRPARRGPRRPGGPAAGRGARTRGPAHRLRRRTGAALPRPGPLAGDTADQRAARRGRFRGGDRHDLRQPGGGRGAPDGGGRGRRAPAVRRDAAGPARQRRGRHRVHRLRPLDGAEDHPPRHRPAPAAHARRGRRGMGRAARPGGRSGRAPDPHRRQGRRGVRLPPAAAAHRALRTRRRRVRRRVRPGHGPHIGGGRLLRAGGAGADGRRPARLAGRRPGRGAAVQGRRLRAVPGQPARRPDLPLALPRRRRRAAGRPAAGFRGRTGDGGGHGGRGCRRDAPAGEQRGARGAPARQHRIGAGGGAGGGRRLRGGRTAAAGPGHPPLPPPGGGRPPASGTAPRPASSRP